MTLAAFDIAELRGSAKRASVLLKAMANARRLLTLCCLAMGAQTAGAAEEKEENGEGGEVRGQQREEKAGEGEGGEGEKKKDGTGSGGGEEGRAIVE